MTQLQNQDPTSPSDTTTFTQELATFAGVQQQVDANTNLNQLIQLTQGEETLQGSAMIGKEVTLNTTTLPLQNGSGTVDYTATTAGEPIEFTISNSSGTQVYTTTVDAPAAGSNSWTWNGQDNSGNQLADGKYSVAVQGQVGSSVAAVPFTVAGTVTGVINSGGTIELNVGALTTPLSSIQSLQ
jgi:flagellar basal-body rod modification protein FlgD